MPLVCLSKSGLESGSMIREHLLVYVNVDWLSYNNDDVVLSSLEVFLAPANHFSKIVNAQIIQR